MILAAAMIFALTFTGCSKQNESEEPADAAAETEAEKEAETEEGSVIDYMVLVNQTNPLPDGWEEALETMNVNIIQGYLFDKPLTQEDFEAKYVD